MIRSLRFPIEIRKCKLSQTHRTESQSVNYMDYSIASFVTSELHHSYSVTLTLLLSRPHQQSSSQLDLHELHIVGIKMIFLSDAAGVQCLVRLEAHVRCSTVRNDMREVRKDRN